MFSIMIRVAFPNIYLRRDTILRISERFASQVKYTAHLETDVEEQIRSGALNLKDRPGRRKLGCVTLPSQLIEAVERVIPDINRGILGEAQKIDNQFHSRRPPIEREEFIHRSEKIFSKLSKDNPDGLTEEQVEDIGKKIKKKLRCEVGRWKSTEYNEYTSKVYLVARLAANYAVTSWVLSEIKNSIPSFVPKTFFDFGSGVGSAVWAAYNTWGQAIEEYFCVDTSADMNNLAELLLKGGEEDEEEEGEKKLFKTVFFRQFLPTSETIKYDLVVSAFSLMELPSLKERLRVIDILWRKTQDTLVVIETGSFAGYSMVLDARDYILHLENSKRHKGTSCAVDAHVVAPCPHDMPCPKMEAAKGKPCNFEVTYNPLFPEKDHGARKERFSFVVLRKKQRRTDVEPWPRVVQEVKKRTRHVYCNLCCSDGQFHEIVFSKTKHSRETYKCARTSSLGDLLPVSLSTVTKDTSLSDATDDLEELEDCSDSENLVNCK